MKNCALLFVLPLMLLVACSQSKQGDTSAIDKQIKEYLSLIDVRRSPDMTIEGIRKHYVELSDILTRSGLKEQADAYLKQAESGEHVQPYLQGVEKTFQQALAILIRQELSAIEASDDYIANVDTVSALFSGLRSTAERRGKYIGSDVLFTNMVDEAVKALKSNADKSVQVQKIRTAIEDVYFLSVLYEVEGITAHRGKDDIVVHEKQIEGVIFYDIIRDSAHDKTASEIIRSEFAKNGNEINLDLVREQLGIAFPDKSEVYKSKF